MIPKIAVIGGGAGGFFSALICAEHFPKAQITIFEKSNKLLSKVKISGGGRCNLTNSCSDPVLLSKFYPRGSQFLKKAFQRFGTSEIQNWFVSKNIPLKTESDGRVFPVSNDSQTIIDCFLKEAKKHQIQILKNISIQKIQALENKTFNLISQKKAIFEADKIIVATGGSPKLRGLQWLIDLGHRIEPPVPSLFTFEVSNNLITNLSGISAPNVSVKISGTKLQQSGALLVTHKGFSGPAILKLSAFGARELALKNYHFELRVSWLHDQKSNIIYQQLQNNKIEIGSRKIRNRNPFQLPNRIWEFLLQKAQIPIAKKWQELSKKDSNRLAEILTNDCYKINRKSTFKNEFVTCGGVSLKDINPKTMESRKVEGIFFVGEIIDIDGVTGGFNFQNAWTTGFIAGSSVLKS